MLFPPRSIHTPPPTPIIKCRYLMHDLREKIMKTQTQYSLIGKFSQYFLLLSRIINAQTQTYIQYPYMFINL